MRTLVYANTPDKARDVQRWVEALAERIPMEVSVLSLEGAGAAEREAARLLREGLEAPGRAVRPEPAAGSGSPEEAIAALGLEHNFGLVVVAPAGRSGFIRLFYGSMVAHVVRRVSTSVLVVRRGTAGPGAFPPRRILVCVSGSRHSLTNVTAGAHLAGLFKAEMSILTILSQVSLGLEKAEPWEADPETFLRSAHPLAAHLRVAGDLARGLGVAPAVRVRHGLVVEEILAEVAESGCDLLVVGTHRAEDFDTVYDDVTDDLVKASPVSTLVVGLRAVLF